MRFRKFIPSMSIVLFLVHTFAGAYYVRLRLHERAMSQALRIDDNAMITSLAFSWPCPVNARDNERRTPLHWAARAGRRELAERLLSKDAEVNAKDRQGFRPLHLAAEYGHLEIAGLLIAKGADVDAKGARGDTPLHFAAVYGQKGAAELLIAQGADANASDAKDGDER